MKAAGRSGPAPAASPAERRDANRRANEFLNSSLGSCDGNELILA